MPALGIDALLYVGTAGSTAATEVEQCQDLNYSFGPVTSKVRTRASRNATSSVVGNDVTVSFTLVNKDGVAANTTIRSAAAAGTALAFRILDKSGGAGIDADFVISQFDEAQPIEGNEAYTVGLELNEDLRALVIET